MAMLQKSRGVRGLKVFTYDHRILPDLGHVFGVVLVAGRYRSIVVALRGARRVTPKRIRRARRLGPGDAQQRLARAKRGVGSDHYSHIRGELS